MILVVQTARNRSAEVGIHEREQLSAAYWGLTRQRTGYRRVSSNAPRRERSGGSMETTGNHMLTEGSKTPGPVQNNKLFWNHERGFKNPTSSNLVYLSGLNTLQLRLPFSALNAFCWSLRSLHHRVSSRQLLETNLRSEKGCRCGELASQGAHPDLMSGTTHSPSESPQGSPLSKGLEKWSFKNLLFRKCSTIVSS